MRFVRSSTLALMCGVGLFSFAGLDIPWLGPIALALALLAGIPHGALDLEMLTTLPARRRWGIVGVYAVLVGTLFLGWSFAPLLLTGVFLGVSAWHFGEGDVRGVLHHPPSNALSVSRGLAVVGVPILAHWTHTSPILVAMSQEVALANVPPAWCTVLAGLLVFQHGVFLIHHHVSHRLVFESLGLLVAMMVAPALVGFALYFGLWHAPSHIRAVQRARQAAPSLLLRSLEYGAATIGLALVGFAWHYADSASHWMTASAISAALISLASLTIPHAILVDFWSRQHLRPSAPIRR